MTISERVQDYIRGTSEHDKEHSWTHCYRYFQRMHAGATNSDLDHAALHLGYYLASWDMHRGKAFLGQYTYTIHLEVVRLLTEPRFKPLRKDEFGTDAEDANLVPLVRDAAVAIREAYQPYALEFKSPPASDTLVTKVLLGTLGCFPACDRYFISGFRRHGFKFSELNSELITTVVRFCGENAGELRRARDDVKGEVGVRYPLMKIVDMCFWKTGEVESGRSAPGA